MRKIIHIDMDSFFASVEIRDNPNLRDKPVAVGSEIQQRGVISTANYIARKYGVHSAMPTYKALQICPKLIVVKGNMQKYKDISHNVRSIMAEYTDLIESLSLDEAFLDVTKCSKCYNSATWIAQEIRDRIYASENLTASAGISINKFIAKVASDWNKPNGQYLVAPNMVDEFVQNLSVKKIFGVGPKTAERLSNLGIHTCSDLQARSIDELQQYFGKFGGSLYYLSRGIDNREVNPNRVLKSLSLETTYDTDLSIKTACIIELNILIERLKTKLSRSDKNNFNKIFVKIKFNDFTITTIETMSSNLNLEKMHNLLIEGLRRGLNKPVRLLGVGVRLCDKNTPEQLELL
jgi:DNA polymerase IV